MAYELSFDSVLAGLPRSRRPGSALLATLRRDETHVKSLRLPSGNRADVLCDSGRKAIENVSIGSSALDLMTHRRVDTKELIVGVMEKMTVRMAAHINCIPPQLELVVVAAKPSTHKDVVRETRIYEFNRSNYIRWVGQTSLENNPGFSALAELPGVLHTGAKLSPGKKISFGADQLKLMRNTGRLPPGWSVEHIQARGLDFNPTPPKGSKKSTWQSYDHADCR